MGMYNELNNISRAVNGQTIQKMRKDEYKNNLNDLKIQLKELLQIEILEGLKNNENIFDFDYKIHTIESVLNGRELQADKITFLKYKNELKNYMLQSYYSIANQTRIIYNRTNEQTNEQERIKLEILEIKKQQEAEKLKKLQTQNAQKQQTQTKQKQVVRYNNGNNWGVYLLKIIKWSILLTFGVAFGLVYMVIKAACDRK